MDYLECSAPRVRSMSGSHTAGMMGRTVVVPSYSYE